jgi:hypothetical protein
MSSKSHPKTTQSREDRLKAALKENLGRRKAQARAKVTKLADDQAAQEQAAQEPGANAPQQLGATAPKQKE